ncbi:MAG: adenylate/guanylate cyclase domain-containing protein [Saprospiraceae bacterium]
MPNSINELPEFYENISFKPSVSIGINSGEMISGNIGSVSLKRLDYTVIGDTVNTAQRLQCLAKPNQVLITENSYKKINEAFKCNRIGNFVLKNKQNETIVYEVLS